MEVIDLTLPLFSGCPAFPGQPAVTLFPWHDLSLHGSRTHALFMVDHTGTHVDVPAHFVQEGKTVEMLDLKKFMGEAITLDVSSFVPEGVLNLPEFCSILGKKRDISGVIVLLYTGIDAWFGEERYFQQPFGVSEEVANFLVERGIKGIGIDAPSIDTYPFVAHHIFLSHEIPIFEGLTHLKTLLGKKATFFGMPLKLVGCSGSPVRALALTD
ncbi:MAG: cyclase family protein [Atribacterota bacterium]|nr:cyclase family protein [Atribacterota bacterium]